MNSQLAHDDCRRIRRCEQHSVLFGDRGNCLQLFDTVTHIVAINLLVRLLNFQTKQTPCREREGWEWGKYGRGREEAEGRERGGRGKGRRDEDPPDFLPRKNFLATPLVIK